MSNPSYLHLPDLRNCFETQPESIVSRTLHSDDRSKIVLFGFAAGQELSEHTASMPAVLHFVSGEAEVKLGAETIQAGPGTLVRMETGLPHAIKAKTELVLLLTLFRKSAD